MDISGKTKIFGVIGDPIGHTLSPTIQNSAFHHLNLDYIFLAFNVKSEELKASMQAVRSLGISGLNVTMPHKLDVINYLDEIDKTSRFLKSVNTIVNTENRLLGYSTDGVGAINALIENGVDLANSNVILLGAGGAGRAIAFSLAEKVSNLVIINRDFKKAKKLAADLSLKFNKNISAESLSTSCLKNNLRDSNVLINSTNVGMISNKKQSIVDSNLLSPTLTVMDIVYNPIETKLLVDARKVGAKTINGIDMLIYQGAASFKLWTGKKAPIKVMKNAALKQISSVGVVN